MLDVPSCVHLRVIVFGGRQNPVKMREFLEGAKLIGDVCYVVSIAISLLLREEYFEEQIRCLRGHERR